MKLHEFCIEKCNVVDKKADGAVVAGDVRISGQEQPFVAGLNEPGNTTRLPPATAKWDQSLTLSNVKLPMGHA